MAQKELVFKLKFVDENGAIVEKTAQSIQDINKSIKDLKSELDNTELGSEAWNELATDLGKAENAMEKVGETTKKAKEGQKSFGDSMSSLPGPIGGVIKGAQAMNAALMKLVLNPIGAVIAAVVLGLTALYKAFTSTKAGGEQMEQVMAGISAAVDVVRDRVLKVGSAIVKFFSGDFKGALEEAKGVVSGFGAEIAAEFQAAANLKKELQSIADATRELTIQRALQNAEIAKAKLVINDETKSYGERQAALEQVRQAEIALSKQEEILALRRYEAIKAQNALSDSSKEALDEEAAAYVALQNAQQMSLQKQKAIFDQQKALRDRQRNEQKAAFEKRKGELETIADIEQQLNLDAIKDAEKRALKELDILEEKLIKQIKSLNAGKEKEKALILKVEQQTEEGRKKIQQEGYDTQLEKVNAFRKQLIEGELLYSTDIQSLLQAQYDDEIKKMELIMKSGKSTQEERISAMKTFEKEQAKILKESKDEYEKYYGTLIFEANTAFAEDIKLSAERTAEQEKQLKEANELNDKKLVMMEEANEKQKDLLSWNLFSDVIIQEEYDEAERKRVEDWNKEQEDTKTKHEERLAEINTYFKDYEVRRETQLAATIKNIETDKQNSLNDLAQKGADTRIKSGDEVATANLNWQNMAMTSFDALAELAGKDTELSKKLASISVLISTYQAAQAAYASQLSIPTADAPIRAAVAASIAVGQGLIRLAAINKIDTNVNAADGMLMGQGSGRMDNMSVNVSNGESIINARSTQRFKPLLSAINMAGGGKSFSGGFSQTQTSPETTLLNSLMGQKSSPMKTYVVSTEVSSSVSLDRQIKSRSVL